MAQQTTRPATVARAAIRAAGATGCSTEDVRRALEAQGIRVRNVSAMLLRMAGVRSAQVERGSRRRWYLKEEQH